MTGRFKQALLEKGKMPKKFSVKSGDKSAAGGLTQKGVKRYRAANPGSKLKTAVTTKPSKLKKGSKSASRRKSFCARMGGMKKSRTSAKTAKDPDSRINKALRKWNCSTDINTKGDPAINERNKRNRDIVRQLTTGQTPAEAKAQRSLKTANPDWITPQDKMSDRQKAHVARRGVKKRRQANSVSPEIVEALSMADLDKLKKGFSRKLADTGKDKKRWKATSGVKLPAAKRPPAKKGWETDFLKAAQQSQHASTEIVRNARLALAEACWKGYKAKGMKKKGSKRVPNCVPESSKVNR